MYTDYILEACNIWSYMMSSYTILSALYGLITYIIDIIIGHKIHALIDICDWMPHLTPDSLVVGPHPLMSLGFNSQPRWLSGLRRSLVHSRMIALRSLCPEKLGSNPGQGSEGINFSGQHGLDMSITVTKRR